MGAVAVTGVAGVVGQGVLRLLDADPAVARVVGIDARDSRLKPAKLEFHRVDLASADLKPLLDGVDTVVHLAFAVSPVHEPQVLARVNVESTRRLLQAAAGAGVVQLIYSSSAMVYGAWGDNPLPLTEDALVRPNPGFWYASHKAQAERLLLEWRAEQAQAKAAVLRPAPSLSAARGTWLEALWRGGPVRLRGGGPPVQYLHEDDLALAVELARQASLDGVFNVAPNGWISGEEAEALVGEVRFPLPEWLARRLLEVGWKSQMSEVPPSALPYLLHPWVVANDRLREVGWEARHSNAEALVAATEAPGLRDALVRNRKRLLAAALGISVAVMGTTAVLVVRQARHRRQLSLYG